VTTEEGDARGREAGVLFIETSAKAGFNIKARTSLQLAFRDTSTVATQIHHAHARAPVWLLQALFRKIAAALPGMETLGGGGGAGRADLVDVTLQPSAPGSAGGVPAAASCSC
jgi:Ras-related protein Rab-6A